MNIGITQETSNYFPKVSSIIWWAEGQLLSFLGLLKMVIYYRRYSFKTIKTQALILFTNSLIFPIARIVLGGRKSYSFCNTFFKALSPTYLTVIFLPPPLKSKINIHEVDVGHYSEIYFEDVYLQRTLKEGMNVIDAGANIGVYTVLAAEKVGNTGKVIAIEPEPKNYKQLLENIELNNFQNVIPKNIALLNHKGSEKLYLSSSPGSHSLIFHEDKNSYIEVPVKTIDKLLEELDIKKVDIIKIDAEGAEAPILKGAEKTLKINPNLKIIVASYHYPSEIKEVQNILENKGYKTKVFSPGIVITS